MMDTDWMKEFDRINIPHADSFVEEFQNSERIKAANKKFSKFYTDCKCISEIKLKFSDNVEIIYFENEVHGVSH